MFIKTQFLDPDNKFIACADMLDDFIENVLEGKRKRAALMLVAILKLEDQAVPLSFSYYYCNDYRIEDDYCGGDMREALGILYEAGFITYFKDKGYKLLKGKTKKEMIDGEIFIQEQ